jgi:transcriptional regulator with XRE-family HTH domain
MPAFFSEGCVALARYLDEQHVEQKDFAEQAEIDAAFLNHILRARKRPSLDTAAAIELASEGQIPARLWSVKVKEPPKPKRKKPQPKPKPEATAA